MVCFGYFAFPAQLFVFCVLDYCLFCCCLLTLFSISVQFSCSVVSDSLQPHESQHTRPPCPSPAPGVYSNSCPLSRWCHPAISSSVVPFSSCPQSLPASGSFPLSQLFAWGGQSTGVSAFSISPSNEHPGLISFRMDWLDLPVLYILFTNSIPNPLSLVWILSQSSQSH